MVMVPIMGMYHVCGYWNACCLDKRRGETLDEVGLHLEAGALEQSGHSVQHECEKKKILSVGLGRIANSKFEALGLSRATSRSDGHLATKRLTMSPGGNQRYGSWLRLSCCQLALP